MTRYRLVAGLLGFITVYSFIRSPWITGSIVIFASVLFALWADSFNEPT